MRSWWKLAGAAGFGLLATSAGAADHTDGPAVLADAAADLADVYAWNVDNNSKLALIMTVVGEFSPSVQYVFHVGRSDNLVATLTAGPPTWTSIICEFETPTSMQCWVDDGSGTAVDYVSGDPSMDAGLTGVNGKVLAHAAEHGDPFYFYLDGFKKAREVVLAAAGANLVQLDPTGCPTTLASNAILVPGSNMCPGTESIAGLLRGLLNGTYGTAQCAAGTPINNFETGNIFGIVMEVDKTAFAGMGEYFAVYASTHEKG